jgi:plastocyanin
MRLEAACAILAVSVSATAAEHSVRMAGVTYQPAKLEAKVGDTIRFINDDAADHEVFVPTKGFGVDLGVQKPGQVTVLQLLKPGSFEVECVMHPHMLLNVMVKE